MQFLSAQWQHLLMANYCVPPEVLEPLVPAGTKLDMYESRAFLSLVAFLFDDMRVLGVPIPFHRRFEEVNLRFYVAPMHNPSIRAVTFVKEVVPRAIIPWVANNLFSENYEALPMSHQLSPGTVGYTWGRRHENRFQASFAASLQASLPGSLSEFITEHYWGYTAGYAHTLQYEVRHPQWLVCEVDEFTIEVDFALQYGQRFGFMNDHRPHNVLYCLGSPVTVSFPSRLAAYAPLPAQQA